MKVLKGHKVRELGDDVLIFLYYVTEKGLKGATVAKKKGDGARNANHGLVVDLQPSFRTPPFRKMKSLRL